MGSGAADLPKGASVGLDALGGISITDLTTGGGGLGFLGDLFSERGGEKKKEFDTIRPSQGAAIDAIMGEVGRALTQFDVAGQYPGPLAAQELSLAGLEALASGAQQGARGETAGLSRDVLNQILSGDTASDFDKFFESNIEDPLLEAFAERIAPAIKRAAIGVGTAAPSTGGAGGTEGVFGRASGDLMTELVRARESARLQFEDDLIRRQLEAIGLAGTVDAQQIAPLVAIMDAAERFRGIDLNRMLLEMDERNRIRQMVASLAGAPTRGALGLDVSDAGDKAADRIHQIGMSFLGGSSGGGQTGAASMFAGV